MNSKRKVQKIKPVHFTICVKKDIAPFGELIQGQKNMTPIEVALLAIEDAKKDHPNAEISVEVEV